MKEVWKNYDRQYQVSNLGKVRAYFTGHILQPWLTNNGYLQVHLSYGKKRVAKTIHALVTDVFIGERPFKFQVNHKDGDKTNNRLDNLEYCTGKQNHHHAVKNGLWHAARGSKSGSSKLTELDVGFIKLWLSQGINQRKIAKECGVDQSLISKINRGHIWTHVTRRTEL